MPSAVEVVRMKRAAAAAALAAKSPQPIVRPVLSPEEIERVPVAIPEGGLVPPPSKAADAATALTAPTATTPEPVSPAAPVSEDRDGDLHAELPDVGAPAPASPTAPVIQAAPAGIDDVPTLPGWGPGSTHLAGRRV